MRCHRQANLCDAIIVKTHIFVHGCFVSSVDFDQRYSTYPTLTYPSDFVSVAKNSKDMNGKTKSARNFIYTLIR